MSLSDWCQMRTFAVGSHEVLDLFLHGGFTFCFTIAVIETYLNFINDGNGDDVVVLTHARTHTQ